MRTPRTPILPSLLLTLCAAPACADDLDAAPIDDDAPVMIRGGDDLSPPPYATPGQWTHDEPTCGERARELVAQFGILAPKAPSSYNPPDPDVLCDGLDPEDCPVKPISTTTELVELLSAPYTGSFDIILGDGIYQANELPGAEDGVAYLTLNGAHRLWAKSAGGAVLTFGIYAGGDPGAVADPDDLTDPVVARFYGPEFHGLVFDLPDRRFAARYDDVGVGDEQFPHDAALANWGLSRDMLVEDCWFRGWGVVRRGISAAQPRGLQLRRVEILDFTRYGVFIDRGAFAPDASTPISAVDGARVEDVVIRGVADPEWSSQCPDTRCGNPDDPAPPGAYCPGTQEHGLWIGDDHTTVERARIRDVGWAGVLVGDAVNRVYSTILRDIDVDDTGSNSRNDGSGVAFERGNSAPLLERFCVGAGSGRGVHSEWDHELNAGGSTGTENERLQLLHGFSRARHVGVSFDKGTIHSRIHDVHIENADVGGMVLHRNNLIAKDDGPTCCTTSTWSDVTMTNVSGCELTFSRYANPEPPPLLCPPAPNPSVPVCEVFPADPADFHCADVLTCP
ncbi:MAG: hypothetical protein KC486_28695 [Myxococcales bacterium]|nr:hypothetical protein [Myxococcales bacterium]